MKTVREIRDEANTVYQKSSHYIAETFLFIGGLVAILKGLISLLGVEIGIPYLFLGAILLSPLEYGMVKAALLACERRAREVKTMEYTFMGFKKYISAFVPFVGRTIVIYVLEALILGVFVYVSMNSLASFPIFLEAVLSGNLSSILQNPDITLTIGALMGVVITLISAFLLEAYFGLSYYFVVEDDMGLMDSLSASLYCMRGNIIKYISIKLCYIVPILIATLGVNFLSMAFQTMFQQLIAIVPNIPIVVFNIFLIIMTSIISAFISTMLYKVKETLAFTIFYKDLKNAYYE